METGVYPIHTSWCTIPIKKACSGNPSIPGKFSGGSNLIMRKTYCGWKKILYQLGTIRYLRNTVNNGRKMGKTIYQLDLKSIHHYLPLLSTLPKTSFFLHSGCIRPHIATSRKFMMVIGGIIRGVWKGEGLWFIFIYLSQWKIHHFFL